MHDDDLNENHVFDVIRDRLSKLTVAKPPPVETIVARGRARRRRSGLAGMGLAAVGLAIALPVIFTSINPAAPAVATHLRLGGGPVHVNLAAYSVDSNANGTVTVALAAKQSFNPSELRQALAQAGIAAVVNVGAFCQTADQPAGFQAVVSSSGRNWAAKSAQSLAGHQTAQAKLTAMVIKPSAMPKRAELSIGYFPDHVAMTLVKVGGRMSCFSSDPPTCNVPLAAHGQSVSSSYGSDATTLPSATTPFGHHSAFGHHHDGAVGYDHNTPSGQHCRPGSGHDVIPDRFRHERASGSPGRASRRVQVPGPGAGRGRRHRRNRRRYDHSPGVRVDDGDDLAHRRFKLTAAVARTGSGPAGVVTG